MSTTSLPHDPDRDRATVRDRVLPLLTEAHNRLAALRPRRRD